MQIKRKYDFNLNIERDKPDAKLRLRIKWGEPQCVVSFNVGYRVDRDKWVSTANRCKISTTHGPKKVPANIINRKIGEFETLIEEVFRGFELKGVIPSADDLRNEMNLALGRVKKVEATDLSIGERIDQFINEQSALNDWTISTIKKFKTLKNHLKEWQPGLTFSDLTENMLSRYVTFLRDVKGHRNSSLHKEISLLKWFLRWATKKTYCRERAFETFAPKLKTAPPKIVFLDWEELMTVYHFEFAESKKHLARIRDVFCFCCFTSLRYSDVANLRRSDVFDTYISLTSIKTSDALKIELNKYSSEILSRYATENYAGDLALPVISNQKMNDSLKEIGEICGIDTPIRKTHYKGSERIDQTYPKYMLLATHVARRTFICNALMMGIPAHIVMKWTGHNDYKAMKPYIDIADNAKADAMKLFNR